MRIQPLLFALVLILTLPWIAGCSSVGFPDQNEGKIDEEISKFEGEVYGSVGITKIESDIAVAVGDAAVQKSLRDEFIAKRLRVTDAQYLRFEKLVLGERIGLNVGTDLAALGLSSAAVLSGGEEAKVMSAIAAGLIGARGVIDKEVFYSKTMPMILAQMSANRSYIRARIAQNKAKPYSDYSFVDAMQDTDDYYRAGTLHYGIETLTGQAAQASQANQKLAEEAETYSGQNLQAARSVSDLLAAAKNDALNGAAAATKTAALAKIRNAAEAAKVPSAQTLDAGTAFTKTVQALREAHSTLAPKDFLKFQEDVGAALK